MLDFIKKVLEKKLTEDEKFELLNKVAEKEINSEELAEIVKYIKSKQVIKLDLPDSLDIVGTGGSNLPRINTSTLTSLKLASEGVKITKHGNNASSGRFGSFDLIEELGYKIPNSKEEIIEEYEKNNLAFLYAKIFYPFFKEFAEVRKRYGKPTIFNLLGPLLSPVNSDYIMIGCSFKNKQKLIIETCKLLGKKRVMVVRGDDGLDEVTITDKTKIFELKNGEIKEYYITPEEFGFKRVQLKEIMAEKIEDKIKISREIISGKCYSAHNDLVEINKIMAMKLLK